MTKQLFKTLLKPISMKNHQQFFMEILSHHQWEALYLWAFTDLVYLLEQEQENIDPESFVKELVETNPIILNALKTTIRQETKKQFNKNISHSYTNKIFPLATKTELRQGGRKQSVQTLIKLIHSVEKYYDDHNGERKEPRTTPIKQDPKKWTWQLYQELNQALMHPSAVHQKLIYQNYSSLETHHNHGKNRPSFNVDEYDVIKKLEILLLPAIEKTRQSQAAEQMKQNSRQKGNLRGSMQTAPSTDEVSLAQIRNIIQRTSVLKKESVLRQKSIKAKWLHSRMIQALLKDQNTVQNVKSIRSLYRESYLNSAINETQQLREILERVSLQRDTTQRKHSDVALNQINLVERLRLNRKLSTTQEEKSGALKGIKGIETSDDVNAASHTNAEKTTSHTNTITNTNNKITANHHRLIYKQSLHKGTEIQERSIQEKQFHEKQIKEILERVSLQRETTQRKQSDVALNQTNLVERLRLKRFVTATVVENLETLKGIKGSEAETITNSKITTKQNHLIYKQSIQHETLQEDKFKTSTTLDEVSQVSVLEKQTREKETQEKQVQEKQIKEILKRVSLQLETTQRKQSGVKHSQTNLVESRRLKRMFTTDIIGETNKKNTTNHHHLIYKQSLQHETQSEENIKTIATHNQMNQFSVMEKQTQEKHIQDKQIKEILNRVSLQLETTQRNQTDLVERLRLKRILTTNAINETNTINTANTINATISLNTANRKTTTNHQHLIYKQSLQHETAQSDNFKKNATIDGISQFSVMEKHNLEKQVKDKLVQEKHIKEILERVSMQLETSLRNQSDLIKRLQLKRILTTNEIIHKTTANHHHLIYKQSFQHETQSGEENIKTSSTRNQTSKLSVLEKTIVKKQINQTQQKELKEKYYQRVPQMIFNMTGTPLENPLATKIVTKLITNHLTDQSRIRTLNHLTDLSHIHSTRLTKTHSTGQPQVQTTSEIQRLNESSIEEIEALRVKLAKIKEEELAELKHERLLQVSSRNLVVKNRLEVERRHMKTKQYSLEVERRHTESHETLHKKLIAKQVEREMQPEKVVHHQTFSTMVQAPTKTMDKEWVKEIVRETSLVKIEQQQMANQKMINQQMVHQQMTNQQFEKQDNNGSAPITAAKNEAATSGEETMDTVRLEQIADQVFKRVTDKIERERKRRGM